MADRRKSRSRRWQAILIRNRGQVLGTIEAPDEQGAELAAAHTAAHVMIESSWEVYGL